MALLASGQITANVSAQPLSSVALSPKKWVFKALSDNTVKVGVGPKAQLDGTPLSTSNCHWMDPGDYIEIDRTIQEGTVYDMTPDDVYVIAAAGGSPIVSWLAFG